MHRPVAHTTASGWGACQTRDGEAGSHPGGDAHKALDPLSRHESGSRVAQSRSTIIEAAVGAMVAAATVMEVTMAESAVVQSAAAEATVSVARVAAVAVPRKVAARGAVVEVMVVEATVAEVGLLRCL